MKLQSMKIVDKYAGWVLCLLLTAINKIKRIFFRQKIVGEITVNKILFIKFWGMGSIINSTPLLRAIKDKYPQAKILFATLSRNKEVAQMFGIVDEVITLEIDRGFLKSIFNIFKIMFSVIKAKPDLTFDLEFFTRFSALITYLSGAHLRVGFRAWEVWRGDLHTIGVPFNRYWHVTKNFYNLGIAVGLQEKEELLLSQPQIPVEKRKDAELILQKNGLIKKQYVCINANAGELALSRRWPKENIIELTERILREFPNIKIIFIGSKIEAPYIDSVITAVTAVNKENLVNFAGKTTVNELAVIFENALLLVSNDSGPLHLAASINTPTISFFGPETPVLYHPLGENNTVLFSNIDCSPCINVHESKTYHCYKKSPDCLSRITTEQVFAEFKRIIRQKHENIIA